ncbi:hypothetical protein [Burkholderia ubonensis]|nr:hypothetical protein [Burkholderia ubonensis]
MMHREQVIPAPASRLAMFRLGRVDSGVKRIAASAQRFRDAVESALSGGGDDAASETGVTKAFVASYQAFAESLEGARAGGVVKGATVDVLESIMKKMRADYADGLTALRKGVSRLEQHGPVSLRDFCSAAGDKIDRLEQFWQTTYQNAARIKM